MSHKEDSVPEFVLGHLSTPEGRAASVVLACEGFYHDLLLEPADPEPGDDVTVSAFAGTHVTVAAVALHYTTDGSQPEPGADGTSSVSMQRSGQTWDTLTWSYGECWRAVIPGQPLGTVVHYVVEGVTPDGETIRSPHVPPPPAIIVAEDRDTLRLTAETEAHSRLPQVYAYAVDTEAVPEWLRNAVIYQIFVDRFAPDPGKEFAQPPDRSGFYGGTLRGVRSKLDYLADLGVTCLWLSPIFPAPSHHGYDATDYGAVEPRLGDLDDFEQLAQAARAHGIHIVLDYVANHISNEHPAFVAAQRDRSADTASWFRFFSWPDDYDTFLGVRSMPRLNTDDECVRAYLIDNACCWLERGADGFRLDHAHGATHAFWSAFRTATRAVKPSSVTFGEVTDTPAIMRSFVGRMDGELDFILLEALRQFFGFHALYPSEFDRFLRRHFAYFDGYSNSDLALPSFFDNHDMNRFLFSVGGDVRRLKLAALCQFTLPEPPIIYYGTEVGLSQLRPADPLEESRLPMLWGDAQDQDLLGFYKELIALRRKTYPVWRRARRTLATDDVRGIYAYACGRYAVVLNNSAQPASIRLKTTADAPLTPVLYTDGEAAFDAETSVAWLPPYSGIVVHGQ
ncbi:MAG: alpha-amylase family glycosyl hydrolase [Caldilineaceae bacterium]